MMSTLTLDNSLDDLIHELSFQTTQQVIKDPLATEILSRIASFRSEVQHFKVKYGMDLQVFKAEYEAGEEDFHRYDDLMAWEFAAAGLSYWEAKLDELKHVL